jgi:hypothetical protein
VNRVGDLDPPAPAADHLVVVQPRVDVRRCVFQPVAEPEGERLAVFTRVRDEHTGLGLRDLGVRWLGHGVAAIYLFLRDTIH